VYFELLDRSGYVAPQLPALLDESRRQAVYLQQEVDKRDQLITDLHQHYQEEIAKRDQLTADLHRHYQEEIAKRDHLVVKTSDRLQADIALRDRLLEEERDTFLSRLRLWARAATGRSRTDA